MKCITVSFVVCLIAISNGYGQRSYQYENAGGGVTFFGFGPGAQTQQLPQLQARSQPLPQSQPQPQSQPELNSAPEQAQYQEASNDLPQPGQDYEQQDQGIEQQQQQPQSDDTQEINVEQQQQQAQQNVETVAQFPQHQHAISYGAAPAVQYHHPGFQYHQAVLPAAAPVQHHFAHFAPQPALAKFHNGYHLHQPSYPYSPFQVGYAAPAVITPAVAQVPVTKVAYSHGITQKVLDVASPAISTRRVKVRRPALRKEFYDIEHRVIIRPAGSATLELSQPISKEEKGPAVISATKFQHIAPVVRYGQSRRIIDGGEAGQNFAQFRIAQTQPQVQASNNEQQAPATRAGPGPQPQDPAPQASAPVPQPQPRNNQDDTQVIEANPQPQSGEQSAPIQPQGRNNGGLTITPDMPAELQNRLIALLQARGGTVTEVLDENGRPADSASVLQVADALGDPSLQGGERVTIRRIVVTRPIFTDQEVEIQEPATKLHRVAVNKPTLFQHHIPAIKQVPLAVKHVAQPLYHHQHVYQPHAHLAAYHHH